VDRLENRWKSEVPFPHKHNFFQLILIVRGRGWHEIDFVRYPLTPYQLFFVKVGQVHRWQMSPDTTGTLIEFKNETILHNSTAICPSWSVSKIADQIDFTKGASKIHEHILNLFDLMLEEYEGEGHDFEVALKHYLIPMLIDLHRLCNGKIVSPRDIDPILDTFLSLVEENYKVNRSLIFYAEKLRTTPKALTMRVSRALGQSARAVVHDRCILEAKRLLGYSHLSLGEVGQEIGFDDPNHFSRFFSEAVGIRPKEFRLQYQMAASANVP
jgi:AraC-like DNA-binding protein